MFNDDKTVATVIRSPEGHCSLETIAKDLSNAFTSKGFELLTEINTSVGQLIIHIFQI